MTFCRKFLKICGKIFGNIWNYFTNISRTFSDFFVGVVKRGGMYKNVENFWNCGNVTKNRKKFLRFLGLISWTF